MPRSEPPRPTDGGADSAANRNYIALLLERFPHVQSVSLTLLHRNEAFRDLCEEYEVCSCTCERLERTNEDEALRREYSALRLRLEGELLRFIDEKTSDRR